MEGGGFMPECYVTKRGYKLVCGRPLHRGVGSQTDDFFRCVLFE